jgi:V/A-type H+-transporting ATPase subunit B
MKKVHDRIKDMRGNLITVEGEGVALGELARVDKKDGRSVYASVLRFQEN